MLKAHKAGNIESYKESKLPINDRNNRIIRKTYLSEWGKMGNDWAIIGQIGQYWGNNWALCVMSGGQKTDFGGQKRWSDNLP